MTTVEDAAATPSAMTATNDFDEEAPRPLTRKTAHRSRLALTASPRGFPRIDTTPFSLSDAALVYVLHVAFVATTLILLAPFAL